MTYRFIALVAILTAGNLAASEVYVWTDENGKKHFGDRPPEQNVEVQQQTYELENVDGGYPSTSPNLYMDSTESYADKKRRERLERQEAGQAKKQYMASACQDAKLRLSTIRGPVNFYDDNGNVMKVTEADRRREEIELRAAIVKHCD